MTPPQTTSVSDCIWLLVISLAGGLLNYLMDRRRYRIAQASEPGPSRHSNFQSQKAFLISWFPWLLFCVGSIGVSVLRDYGFIIFPWPMLANFLLLSLWLNLAQRLQSRYTSRTDTVA